MSEFNYGLENELPLRDEVVAFPLESFSISGHQIRKCKFIKTICKGLWSLLTVENEIVLLQYLTCGLLTLKYHFGHIAGHEVRELLEKAQYLYIFGGQHEKAIFFWGGGTIEQNCLFNSYGVWCPCFLVFNKNYIYLRCTTWGFNIQIH